VPLSKVKILIMDVDGVLTDGRIVLDSHGGEVKAFHAHDGAGIKYLHRAGLLSAILSGRASQAVMERAGELEIQDVYQGFKDKIAGYEEIKSRHGLRDEQVCYIGDDLPDIPVLRQAGYAVAVPAAPPEVKAVAHYVTAAPGGRGAVREVAEKLLKAQGKWSGILQRYGLS